MKRNTWFGVFWGFHHFWKFLSNNHDTCSKGKYGIAVIRFSIPRPIELDAAAWQHQRDRMKPQQTLKRAEHMAADPGQKTYTIRILKVKTARSLPSREKMTSEIGSFLQSHFTDHLSFWHTSCHNDLVPTPKEGSHGVPCGSSTLSDAWPRKSTFPLGLKASDVAHPGQNTWTPWRGDIQSFNLTTIL